MHQSGTPNSAGLLLLGPYQLSGFKLLNNSLDSELGLSHFWLPAFTRYEKPNQDQAREKGDRYRMYFAMIGETYSLKYILT